MSVNNWTGLCFVILLCSLYISPVSSNSLAAPDYSKEPSIVRTSCVSFKNALSAAILNLTRCYLDNSLPFRICTRCLEQYLHYKAQYEEGINVTTVDGSSCYSKLISSDRIHEVAQQIKHVEDTWRSSNCNCCYTNPPNLGVGFNNATQDYLDVLNLLLGCLGRFIDPWKLEMDSEYLINNLEVPWNAPIKFNNTACQDCLQNYTQLRWKFSELLFNHTHTKKKVCFDLVDSHNYTVYLWDRMFQCHPLGFPNTSLHSLPLIVAILSLILFYTVMCFYRQPLHIQIYHGARVGVSLGNSDGQDGEDDLVCHQNDSLQSTNISSQDRDSSLTPSTRLVSVVKSGLDHFRRTGSTCASTPEQTSQAND